MASERITAKNCARADSGDARRILNWSVTMPGRRSVI
jgi:hypothetical protein